MHCIPPHPKKHTRAPHTTPPFLPPPPVSYTPSPPPAPPGASCPQVCPGEVTLVTGVPNSGKSEWLDALAINLAERYGWRFAMCSMEKRPRDHARQLLEKHAQKPLLQAAYAEGSRKMDEKVSCARRAGDSRRTRACMLYASNYECHCSLLDLGHVATPGALMCTYGTQIGTVPQPRSYPEIPSCSTAVADGSSDVCRAAVLLWP